MVRIRGGSLRLTVTDVTWAEPECAAARRRGWARAAYRDRDCH